MAFGMTAAQVAMVGVGANLASGALNAGAASSASGQMVDSGNAANATIAEAQRRAEALLKPWVSTGQQANNALALRLGIGAANGPGSQAYQRLYDANRAATIARGADPNDPNFERNLQLEVEAAMRNEPTSASTDPLYGSLLKPFDATDLKNDLVYQNGLQFGLDTGINQINNRAAATGGYGSGAALKALTRFGNDYATTKTADAYSRNMADKNQTYSFLSGMSGQGQNAAAGTGASGLNSAGQIANNQTGIGNAQAGGTIASANALTGGITGATNAFQWNKLLSKSTSPADFGWGTGTIYGNQDYGSYL